MKILLNFITITSERLGGGWTYALNLLRELETVAEDHELIVIASRKNAQSIDFNKAKLLTFNIQSDSRIQRVYWEQFKLPSIVRSINPDVFHGLTNILPLKLSCPSVVTIHDFYHVYCPENLSWLRRQYLTKFVPKSLQSATRIIADSESTKQDALRLTNISAEKIETVYLGGLSDDDLQNSHQGEGVVKKIGIKKPYLLSVGSSLPHKNLVRLIKAFALISHKISQDLILVGEKFEYGSMLQKIADEELKDQRYRLKHLGFVTRKELTALYSNADAFIIPSLYEGFGIPVLEAMQSGCPVIASCLTSLPEVGGDAAEYFNPLDTEKIAHSILRVALEPEYRAKLQKKGYAQAKKFSWKKTASETLEVYNKAVAMRRNIS